MIWWTATSGASVPPMGSYGGIGPIRESVAFREPNARFVFNHWMDLYRCEIVYHGGSAAQISFSVWVGARQVWVTVRQLVDHQWTHDELADYARSEANRMFRDVLEVRPRRWLSRWRHVERPGRAEKAAQGVANLIAALRMYS